MKIILFIYGSIIGSFLPLLVERIIAKKNFIWSRSQCTVCCRKLDWFELIPIFSFVTLRGKCRVCKIKLPYYLLVYEFSTGFLFTLYGEQSFKILCLLICFEIISLFDLFTFQFSLWWLPLIFALAIYDSPMPYNDIVSILILYLIILLINYKFKWIGNGDLDLLACILISTNLMVFAHTLLLASASALLYCWFKKNKVVPFTPFLFNNLIVVLFLKSILVTM
ncbi:A24 family peptidase [Fructilactobacillus sanfranciscensis]|uniref:prepilin peptidase n=1 Tax=Fructilactobacillus sanfranciscensis TaxID=1625 RepID=UPI000CD3EA21|nr:prepilin peptidase [Fructilactobacillus sanfranciscensis]NDR69729.1 prepilin peptidase [Fructilactobacillus sanfranciscensis]NDS16171.1 prepilin peptidase [Fructilactobacillus sanfranciscensis]POH20135.1 hypothetical protein BGL46_02985 [Fructilactobacillus sanfranciscensis]TNK95860.1 prepilin peptidase [Fructilactobacillus sanfranciscensis]